MNTPLPFAQQRALDLALTAVIASTIALKLQQARLQKAQQKAAKQ
jgi:hypothetical protein